MPKTICKIFTEVCSYGSNCQKFSVGSDNGLAPNRQQAIIWINVDVIHFGGLLKSAMELYIGQREAIHRIETLHMR